MRTLTPSTSAVNRRGSNAGLASTLASPNQARYKGLISTPGITKFSAWKRETEIPRYVFQMYIVPGTKSKYHILFKNLLIFVATFLFSGHIFMIFYFKKLKKSRAKKYG